MIFFLMCVFIYYLKSETFWLGHVNMYFNSHPLYCLNNNLLFMEKIPFSTIFIPKIFLYGNWSIKSSC
jgi:hypothetical protein